jgi:acetyl esterase/lipase
MARALSLLLAAAACLALTRPAAGADDAFSGTVRLATSYRVVGNQTYVTANGRDLKLDVYVPWNPPAAMPVVMIIHGGGWVIDTRDTASLEALPYMQMGFAVVNIDYRLAKEALAPAAVEDSLCALQWIGRNAKRFNFDLSKVVVTGASAGGHLALVTGMLPSDTPFANQCAHNEPTWSGPYANPAPKVAAVVNWFGITDVADMLQGPNTRSYAVSWFGSMNERMALARALSPITYARAGAPPVLTIHGDNDPLVPYAHATRLKQAMDKAGQKNQLITIKGGGHGGFNADQQLANFEAIRAFLREQGLIAR